MARQRCPPNGQWNALHDFVCLTNHYGFYLNIQFAALWPDNQISQNLQTPQAAGLKYAKWINRFIDSIAKSQCTVHGLNEGAPQNVLVWGLDWSLPKPSTDTPGGDPWGIFWNAVYNGDGNTQNGVLQQVQQDHYTAGRSLIGIAPVFFAVTSPNNNVLPQLGGYRWTWDDTQNSVYHFANQVKSSDNPSPPDVVLMNAYNANADDLNVALKCVAGIKDNNACPTTTCDGGRCIPANKMLVSELAISTGFEQDPKIGNGIASYSVQDAQTPTTTTAGQSLWLKDTLCVLNSLNVPGYAYFGLYDSNSWWELYTDQSPFQRAWTGYLGLTSEDPTYNDSGNKTAFNTFASSSLSCPSAAEPVLAMRAEASYYTINDTIRADYTAANVTSLSLSEPGSHTSFSCDPLNPTFLDSILKGSCAFVVDINSGTTRSFSLQLTGSNNNASPTSVPVPAQTVTIGMHPIVTKIINLATNQSCDLGTQIGCPLAVGQTDTIRVEGQGFKPDGGNTIGFAPPSDPNNLQWWLYEGDGLAFSGDSYTVIDAQLGDSSSGFCRVPPGPAALQVWNPHQGSTPDPVNVTVTTSNQCH